MGFRDDRDASRARAEALQRELDDALKELGRLQISQLEASEEAEALRRRVAELEKTRAAMPQPAGGNRGARSIALLLVVLLVALGGVVAFLRSSTDHTRARAELEAMNARLQVERAREEARRAEEQARLAEEEARRAAAQAPVPAEPVPSQTQVSVSVRRRIELTWPAKVVRAQGKLRRGARCAVQARLESTGASLDAEVDVTCGDEVLYRWADPLGSGMQMRDCSVGETPGPGGTFLHRLTCSDLGARTGRPQMSLDTEAHTAAVWSEGAPSFRVELAVSGDGSTPGPPLVFQDGEGADAVAFAVVDRAARVTSVTGTAPVARGASCRVRIEPRAGNQNCRAEVRCGTSVLYGSRASNGFNVCELDGGAFVSVRDDRTTAQGGDPRLTFELASGRLVVGDDDPTWEATLTLAR